jgi:hypothetical protein
VKKYAIMIPVIVLVVLSAFAAADTTLNIKVSLLKYTPFPAEPGNYVTLTLKVENKGSGDADNVRLKISPEYPFSLDSNSTVKIGNSATPLPVNSDMIVSLGKLPVSEYALVEYKVRIAADALEGNRQITVWHQPKASDSWTIETFNILVQGTDRLEVADVVPSMLTPGKPTNVVFVFNNSGTAFIRNVIFTWSEKDGKILPLGSGNRKYIESIGPKESAGIPFTLVADPSATSGAYTLNANITYTIGANISKSLNVNVGMFIGGNANFDVSVQESQSGSVSLSIANVGSNPTTSVSVRIPEQENFNVIGTSSSFLGNLNPGDFTLASFQIAPKSRNATGGQGVLKVEISYTDTNSNRQVIEKEIPVKSQGLITSRVIASQGNSQSDQFQRQSGSGLNLVIFGIAGIVIVIVLFKYRSKVRSAIKKVRK